MINDIVNILGYALLILSALMLLVLMVIAAAWAVGFILRQLKMFWQIAYMVGHFEKVKYALQSLPENGNHVVDKSLFERAQRLDGCPSNAPITGPQEKTNDDR